MWLNDEEIQAHIDAGTQERFLIAIDALYGRYEFGDPVDVTPLTADLLRVCADELPRRSIDRFLDFVIGVDEVPSLPHPDNWREVMKAVCLYFGTTGAFKVALIINIDDDGAELVATVMPILEQQVAETPDDRLFFPGYFLDELIDGEKSIWDAVMTALDQWPVNAKTRAVTSVFLARLDEERQARWLRSP
jgi:hypothetical protein